MDIHSDKTKARGPRPHSAREVLGVFLVLGLTGFGGPVAHLGLFRNELVQRRRWLDERAYGDLVALCQFLPGPSSSQVGFALGMMRAGWAGAVAAFVGFTLPSALLMAGFAMVALTLGGPLAAGALGGLKVAAVAVVAQAVLGMARSLCPDAPRATIAVAAAAVVVLLPGPAAMPLAIAIGALAGALVLGGVARAALAGAGAAGTPAAQTGGDQPGRAKPARVAALPVRGWQARLALGLLLGLLVLLPLLAPLAPGLAVADAFFRAGALVFGGGHVVLPLLEAEVVGRGLVTRDAFLAGYGAAQAVPGPLFTFAAYLGALIPGAQAGLGAIAAGVLLALGAVFLPGLLALIAVLPHWQRARALPSMQALMMGANAAVVGVLGAVLHSPIHASTILAPADLALALACFVALTSWRAPAWAVVGGAALAGALIGA